MGFDIPDNDVAFNTNQSIWMSADIDILTSGFSGAGVLTGCAVTAQGTPNMTVAIAAGTIRIASSASVAVASGNGTIAAASATNPRIDLISASNSGVKTVTTGTAAANPKAPDLPAGNIGLAMVYVPANDTAIASNQITDKRVILPTDRGAAFPAQPAYGNDRPFYRTDLAIWYTYDGAAWWVVRTLLPLTGSVSVTADLNNIAPGNGGFVVLAADASPHNITGMVAGIAGEYRIISNDRTGGGGALTLVYNSGSSSAGNKFAGNSGGNKVLAYQQSVLVIYDGTYWIVVG